MDKCGVCEGKNDCIGCDGNPFSGKVLDMCDNCLSPDDGRFDGKYYFILIFIYGKVAQLIHNLNISYVIFSCSHPCKNIF